MVTNIPDRIGLALLDTNDRRICLVVAEGKLTERYTDAAKINNELAGIARSTFVGLRDIGDDAECSLTIAHADWLEAYCDLARMLWSERHLRAAEALKCEIN